MSEQRPDFFVVEMPFLEEGQAMAQRKSELTAGPLEDRSWVPQGATHLYVPKGTHERIRRERETKG